MIILRTGALYSVIICAFISLSCIYPSFLISLKEKFNREDKAIRDFLVIMSVYWAIYAISNLFVWMDLPSIYRPASYVLALLTVILPIPLFSYFLKNKIATTAYAAIGLVLYILSVKELVSLVSVAYWGVAFPLNASASFLYYFGMMFPLFVLAGYSALSAIKTGSKTFFVELVSLIFIALSVLDMAIGTTTWELLLLRMFYVMIGIVGYFYLTGEEATIRFMYKVAPNAGKAIAKLREVRVPFFAKLLMLFLLLSVIPIAGAGYLMFATFKEIIDIYIYKPLLWNLKTSKEEFIVALNNVQIQAIFLIILAIIIVAVASGIASRAIAQSLRRIAKGMKSLEAGDYSIKLEPGSNDEIGDLAKYFNKMAMELKRSRQIMENWNKELEHTVAERTKDLQTLYNITKAMSSTLNLNELLEKSVTFMPHIGGSEDICIFLADKDGEFKARFVKGFPRDLSFAKGEGSLGNVITSSQILKVIEIKEMSLKERGMLSSFGFRSLLAVPMENKGIMLGLIVVGIKREYTPTDIELNLISTISDQMAIALENSAVFEKEKEAVKKLIDIDNMKTELISMVSHELRTPITSIKGFLAHFIAGNTGPVNDTQKKFLGIMSKEGEHLLALVDNLLEFSRIEREGLKAKNEKLIMDNVIKSVVEAIQPQLESRKVALTLDLSSTGACFMGDDLRIGQVVKNLIGNSLKFTPETPKINISSRVNKGFIEVSVSDNGIGMDKEKLELIFNKFYQGDSSLTRRFGGLGLGLAISKEIVNAHGGSISARSDGPGHGSTFIFTVPVIK